MQLIMLRGYTQTHDLSHALILVLVAIVVIAALTLLGPFVAGIFSDSMSVSKAFSMPLQLCKANIIVRDNVTILLA